MTQNKIIFIVGPTAVGKSEVAFYVAQAIRGEIISCDAMQVYKEINIASNKPGDEMTEKIKHHLIGFCPISQEFNVAQFNEDVFLTIQDIYSRKCIPIIVGGSGMYMKILLDGIFQGEGKNEELRKELNCQAQRYGNQFLYDKLKERDPAAAEKIHPNDIRRVVRALEVCMDKNIPMSQRQKECQGLWGQYDIRMFMLDCDRERLYHLINERVEKMFQEGIIEEIKMLNDVTWGKTAQKIIGMQEIQGFLKGDHNLQTAKDLMKMNTRRLAKRQMTWFRGEKRLEWIIIEETDTLIEVARTIVDEWHSQGVKR